MRLKRNNPFAGVAANPFTSLESVVPVVVPPAPETHERRQPRRGYLAPGGGNPLDGLLGALGGGGKPRRPVEYVRRAEEPAEEEAAELPLPPHPHGKKRG